MFVELKSKLNRIEELYGGDITFIPKTSIKLLKQCESTLGFDLPKIFSYFYTEEANGLRIDNKLIYSVFDDAQRKTLSDNLQRVNNPKTSYFFKYKPEVFNDYLIIASDNHICFTIYKHRNLDNPSIYICENPNTKGEVILEKLDLDLGDLIETMAENTFE